MSSNITRAINQFKELNTVIVREDENTKKLLESYLPANVKKGVEFLQGMVTDIESHLKKFNESEDRWYGLIASMNEDDRTAEDDVMKKYMEAEDGPESVREHAYTLLSQFKKLIASGERKVLDLENKRALTTTVVTPPTSTTRTTSTTASATTSTTTAPVQHFKVNKMPLPDLEDSATYRRFFQAFDRTVHCQPWSDDVKLTYMLPHLKGEAAKAVAGFDLTEENYQLVRERLKARFGDETILKNALLQKVLSLKKPGESYRETVAFVDEMEALVQQAESLQMTGFK